MMRSLHTRLRPRRETVLVLVLGSAAQSTWLVGCGASSNEGSGAASTQGLGADTTGSNWTYTRSAPLTGRDSPPPLSAEAAAKVAAGCVASNAPGIMLDPFVYQDQSLLDEIDLTGCTGDPSACASLCKNDGLCCSVAATDAHGAMCIAVSDAGCRASVACGAGRCFAHCGDCVAMDDADCAAWNEQAYEGDRARFGACIVTPESCAAYAAFPCNKDADGIPCVVHPPYGLFTSWARCAGM